jgi:hypothetical protein
MPSPRWFSLPRSAPRPVTRPRAAVRPCLEHLEDRLAPATMSTSLSITNISSLYTPISQLETVTAKVTSSPGVTVNQGQVSFTDGGQTQTADVHNGFATTTFTFAYKSEMPHPHPVTAAYSVPPGSTTAVNFDPSSATSTAPDTSLGAFLQFVADAAFVYFVVTSVP